jgi:hypothetical protein
VETEERIGRTLNEDTFLPFFRFVEQKKSKEPNGRSGTRKEDHEEDHEEKQKAEGILTS